MRYESKATVVRKLIKTTLNDYLFLRNIQTLYQNLVNVRIVKIFIISYYSTVNAFIDK